MTQRHKWAEVIHAFAEGKEIQYRNKSIKGHSWENSKTLTGIDYEYLEWRIKPQKKTYWVNVYRYHTVTTPDRCYESKEEALEGRALFNYIGTYPIEIEVS